MIEQFKAVRNVLRLAERLKFELRHSYLSNGRQESVAEHTWRMSLMAILLEPYLEQPVDLGKTLKMIIIHDLVEAEAGDVPASDALNNDALKAEKQRREQQAIENIRELLGNGTGKEIYDLWQEFEERSTYEAKFAVALDKIEVQLQHNEADISTWEEIEYGMVYLMDQHAQFDNNLKIFKDLIETEAEDKMREAGADVDRIKADFLAKYNNGTNHS